MAFRGVPRPHRYNGKPPPRNVCCGLGCLCRGKALFVFTGIAIAALLYVYQPTGQHFGYSEPSLANPIKVTVKGDASGGIAEPQFETHAEEVAQSDGGVTESWPSELEEVEGSKEGLTKAEALGKVDKKKPSDAASSVDKQLNDAAKAVQKKDRSDEVDPMDVDEIAEEKWATQTRLSESKRESALVKEAEPDLDETEDDGAASLRKEDEVVERRVVEEKGLESAVVKSKPMPLPRSRKRILVTGGAGFVGSHLVDRLLERGDSVVVVDSFFTGRRENVAHHFGDPRFELIRHDVVEPLMLEVDQIYHLACPASPVFYKYNPVKTIKTSVMGTLNMLGLAKRVKARFLVTSTSEVYGDPEQHPQTEEYWGHVNPIGERSCYDEGKRTAEALTMDYHRGSGVDVRIARIFNTYGPRMLIDDGRVVSNFVAQALRKEPMTVYGDGKQTRSFQYVSDLVAGLMALMDGEHIGPFNLGNPGEFTMLELAEVVREVIDPAAQIAYRENTADDPHQRKPDISKAKALLKWEPKVPLREGLPLMVEDFKARLKTPKQLGASQ
ncbi:dTDP-glucose 4-6-dehydratase/UDP-glucuronic acid decarboxylase [Klebsormidium nitens]|uniref:UDP-glucuronate decarboxylase n=1 Tax=Klebsormidium nitens TaxID=105231 RepID=A0A1Y1I517_KLENI|nr:dTDP-glucose 4-6-dehydratase/UDP-glucuronic acid decarboxylase [Klebsormidium nitens]|eukprot:GAQ86044.1 dTDP-glucose 4-6-dehydratase/UDP-glucuronic acid decarboxylase [Klebsormidium nitens]